MTFLLFLFVVLLGVPSSQSQESDVFQIKSQAKRQKDQSVKVEFEAVFPVSAEAFWKTVMDYGSYPEFVPNVSDAEYLGKLRGMDRVYLQVKTPLLLPDVWSILDVKQDGEAQYLDWKMRKGNMEKNEGSFSVDSLPKSIKIKGEAIVNPGAFVPNRLVIWASKYYTPRLLRAFGQEILRRQKPEIKKATTPPS